MQADDKFYCSGNKINRLISMSNIKHLTGLLTSILQIRIAGLFLYEYSIRILIGLVSLVLFFAALNFLSAPSATCFCK